MYNLHVRPDTTGMFALVTTFNCASQTPAAEFRLRISQRFLIPFTRPSSWAAVWAWRPFRVSFAIWKEPFASEALAVGVRHSKFSFRASFVITILPLMGMTRGPNSGCDDSNLVAEQTVYAVQGCSSVATCMRLPWNKLR